MSMTMLGRRLDAVLKRAPLTLRANTNTITAGATSAPTSVSASSSSPMRALSTTILTSPFLQSKIAPQMLADPPIPPPPLLIDPSSQEEDETTSQNNSTGGFFRRLWSHYSLQDNYDRTQRAEQFYQAITVQATNPQWFATSNPKTDLRVTHDFRRQHALFALHLWLLHKRLLHDTHDAAGAQLVQEELFMLFWDDTTSRIRQQGVYELSVNKNLEKVQQYTWIHLTNYDHVYTEFLTKPKERRQELYKLLQRHFLLQFETGVNAEQEEDENDDGSKEEAQDQNNKTITTAETLLEQNLQDKATAVFLDKLAWYVEANYQNIVQDWPDDLYRQGRVAWINLPFDDNTAIKELDGVGPAVAALPKPWLPALTQKGDVYYWNTETQEATWEKPVQ